MRQEDLVGVALGQAIRAFRSEQRLTQEELAHRTGITVGHLSKIERGQSNARFLTVVRIAKGLNVSSGELAGRADAVLRESELGQKA